MIFYLYWTDINFEKQQEMISFLKEELLEQAKAEAEDFLKRPEHKGETWYKAYASEYSVDWQYADEANYDWELAINDYLEAQAEKKLSTEIRAIPIEVEE